MPRDKTSKEITPEVMRNPINYKILVLMIVGFSVYQTYLNIADTSSRTLQIIVEAIAIVTSSAAGILSLHLALTKYRNTKIGRNFVFFSLTYLFTALGEITFTVYDEIGLDPFPSIADVFFIMYYPFLFLFIHQHYKIFPSEKQKNTLRNVLLSAGIIAMISLLYILYSINAGFSDISTIYGFVVQSLDVVVFALVLRVVFRHKAGMLHSPWVLLLYGVLSITIADIWYYHMEILGQYEIYHPLNLFYNWGYLLIVYATIKHRQVI